MNDRELTELQAQVRQEVMHKYGAIDYSSNIDKITESLVPLKGDKIPDETFVSDCVRIIGTVYDVKEVWGEVIER